MGRQADGGGGIGVARSAAHRARHRQETRRWRERLEPAARATALSCETIPALRIFYNRDTVKTLANQRASRFRTIQVCPKDLRAAMRQAGVERRDCARWQALG